jgi:hypothetical protein
MDSSNTSSSKTSLSNIDFYHFTYYIVTTFARCFENICDEYHTLLNDKWWYNIAEEFVPIIESDEEVYSKLYERVMTELESILTNEQKVEIYLNRDCTLEQIKSSIYGFNRRNISVCYCGDEDCDWTCGVQPCGCCIDSIKCDYYGDYRD